MVGLIVIRLALLSYLSGLDPAELGMLFFLIAVAYIVPWRIVSFVKYRKLLAQQGNA
ncbi:cytochrome c biogenesis protein CcdC [Paenibacillus sp. MZ04-78.2]|nr:cytochrome c biogenesis protein CcdC [Paenibacillus sp. MZ04-78.2]